MRAVEVIFLVVLLFMGIFAITLSSSMFTAGGTYSSVFTNLTSYTITGYQILAVIAVIGACLVLIKYLGKWGSGGGLSQF